MREVQERLDAIDAREGVDTIKDSDGDMVVVREELHRQAGYLRNTESTNARLEAELSILRERQESVEVLKEEKRWLEGRLRKFDEMRERVVSLEAEVEAARKEREDWYVS
jgi:mitotic spindle assembly checkpoint protein MAD1